MSLHAFKESLKPCSNLSSLASASSPIKLSQEFEFRRPQKSSISQQLLRLQDPLSLPETPSEVQEKRTHVRFQEAEAEEEEEEKKRFEFGRPKSAKFQFDHAGPLEPLVLTSEGEVPVVKVPASINCRLLEHQREGVKVLYRLYKNNHGGILGDDMGLGKTIQTIAFLAAVFRKDDGNKTIHQENHTGPELITCPTSVINNWEIEFSRWSSFTVSIYHGANREMVLEKIESRGTEVLITSFDTYRIQGTILSNVKWEVVVVDEAHRLKNEKSKLYTACLEIKTMRRIGLTETAMQNKLMELFNLFDWVYPGSLGTREHFREFYDEPLRHGQRSSAPARFVRVADERKQHLASVLHNFFCEGPRRRQLAI